MSYSCGVAEQLVSVCFCRSGLGGSHCCSAPSLGEALASKHGLCEGAGGPERGERQADTCPFNLFPAWSLAWHTCTNACTSPPFCSRHKPCTIAAGLRDSLLYCRPSLGQLNLFIYSVCLSVFCVWGGAPRLGWFDGMGASVCVGRTEMRGGLMARARCAGGCLFVLCR